LITDVAFVDPTNKVDIGLVAVVTSARKFNVMTLTDMVLFARLLLNSKLMTQKDLCATWYDLSKRGE